ncbi:hypothetical protein RSPO_c02092 [Ralstonia solanacearum Po82]|uniref:Uncharacterized protein n=1 Tax=Ralstonia solanacearum (strain Po82) TaxID=1031711 RepID=F6G235_RALS8|nr:hypothetical protein RSPO_c02092 [Ralstonia solanacearum Po82]
MRAPSGGTTLRFDMRWNAVAKMCQGGCRNHSLAALEPVSLTCSARSP